MLREKWPSHISVQLWGLCGKSRKIEGKALRSHWLSGGVGDNGSQRSLVSHGAVGRRVPKFLSHTWWEPIPLPKILRAPRPSPATSCPAQLGKRLSLGFPFVKSLCLW